MGYVEGVTDQFDVVNHEEYILKEIADLILNTTGWSINHIIGIILNHF